ncbi:MAG: hypothetical protein ABSD92_11230 [Candidatus Bathyarchaeia archaeon]|jgi:membrane protein implicated in regulation of membrane protease activity
MKFKTEVCLLSLALLLFAISAFFYSYQTGNSNFSLNWSYPYQGYALALVSFGSVLMVTASVSFLKRGKNMFSEDFDFSAKEKSN